MLNAERLRNLRKKKGLKQIDVATAINLERTTYVKYETSGIQPPTDVVVKLAEFFNTTTDYLLGNTNDPTPPDKKENDDDPDIVTIQRLRKNMGPVDREKMMKLLRITFDELFPKEKDDKENDGDVQK